MKVIDMEKSERKKIYKWFSSFDDTTYGICVSMNVTKLVKLSKIRKKSFFINFLYIIVNGLNSVQELRIRLVDNQVILYETINPSYTVMKKNGVYDNASQKYNNDYKTFYDDAKRNIDSIKEDKYVKNKKYNTSTKYDDYYITCLPWINFLECHHPIPTNKSSQSVPRVCFGKYEEKNNEYFLTLNVTVSHMFVDGYHLSQAFINIQNLLDNCDDILK